MSKTITMNIRVDDETRQELKEFANQVGIPASSLVNASIRQMLRNRQVTFSTGLEPTSYLEKIMDEVEIDIKADKNISPTFDTVEEMFDHLKANA